MSPKRNSPSSNVLKDVSASKRLKKNEEKETSSINNHKVFTKRKLSGNSENITKTKRLNNAKQSENEMCLNSTEMLPGTISSIVLRNFMCHSHLEMTFDKNINYLVGSNGSGKSAILSSLILVLGERANVTSRCQNIKSFIKTDESRAVITIFLNNVGENAYKPSVFGNKICIERHITHNSGAYKIKSASGKVISTQCSTLKSICYHFNILINNPVCILNQDTARNFLSSSDPKKLFEFFWRATRLEEINSHYDSIVSSKMEMQESLEEKTNEFKHFAKQVVNLEKKLSDVAKLLDLKALFKNLENELAWSKVKTAENECKELESVETTMKEKSVILKNVVEKFHKRKDDISSNLSGINGQVNEITRELEENKRKLSHKQQQLSELKLANVSKENKKKEVERSILIFTKDYELLEAEIKNYNIELEKCELAKADRHNKLTNLKEEGRNIKHQLITVQNEQFQLKKHLEAYTDKQSSLFQRIQELNRSEENIKANLSNLKAKDYNELSLYGRNMNQIVTTINAWRNKFRKLPVGPLGIHIKLKSNKWTVAVESYLQLSTLKSFCVDNSEDYKLFMKLLKQTCVNESLPNVVITKFFTSVHQVNSHKVHPVGDSISMFDALDVNNTVVLNYLIDMKQIERIVLIPDINTAIRIMSSSQNVPPNCVMGITSKGDVFYPYPNYKKFASRYHVAKYLQGNNEVMISELEKKLRVLIKERPMAQQEQAKIQDDIANIRRNLSQLSDKARSLLTREKNIQNDVIAIESQPLPEIGSVESLKAEMTQLKENISKCKVKLNSVEDEMKSYTTQLKKIEEEVNSWQNVCDQVSNRIDSLKQQVAALLIEDNELSIKLSFEMKRFEESKQQLEQFIQKNLIQKATMEKLVDEAKSCGEPVNVTRSSEEISKEMDKTEKKISSIESETPDSQYLRTQYSQKQNRMKEYEEIMSILNENVEFYYKLAEKQKRKLKRLQEKYSSKVRNSFTNVLEFRKFKGDLEVDLKGRTITMKVMPHKGTQGETKTTNLSGGERSFTTVAFLYSLWQCTKFPFYFLDEFDVFMDKSNRTKVMDILISHAKSQKGSQFVFLTPQDMSFLKNDNDVIVHKLQNPRDV